MEGIVDVEELILIRSGDYEYTKHFMSVGRKRPRGAETSVHGMEERLDYSGVAGNLVEEVEAFEAVSGKESQRCVFQRQEEEEGNVQCSHPIFPRLYVNNRTVNIKDRRQGLTIQGASQSC